MINFINEILKKNTYKVFNPTNERFRKEVGNLENSRAIRIMETNILGLFISTKLFWAISYFLTISTITEYYYEIYLFLDKKKTIMKYYILGTNEWL